MDLYNYGNNIIPGYYWTKHILYWTTDTGTSLPRTKPVLCGAYKKTVGKYFIDCGQRRFSLCQITDFTEWKGTTYKQCFSGQSTTIDALYSVGNTTVKSAVSVSKSIERTRTSRNLPVTESISDRNETEVSIKDEAEQRTEHEHDSNIGVKAGVPVAIILALICGSLISIYLSRRYKCWQSRKSTKDNARANTPSSIISTMQENGQSNAVHKLSKDIPIKISDYVVKAYVPKKNENVYTDSNPEYATVNKNMKQPHAQTRHGKSTGVEYNSGQSNDAENNEMNSYSYAFTSGEYFANAKEIQTAEYSFATELDGELDNTNVNCNVTEGDYDVSGKVGSCSVNKSNNIYNTLQSGEYDSSAHVLKRNNCNHIYGVPQNAGSESVYNSVDQGNGSKQPDNIYNQLTNKASGSDKENK
ncbi:uncharacterized protein LOC123547100 isoform X2 [Mercenaria mercenaria]|uniref:uncharacterized protein LOC123547100 isoform X2 n=1 Tax=Mercenaria mercenaria TaxID=6596 RepID=UPI00234F4548|nr:uncharacterized protein LOC123547100 isoform X2 [Mercenaria mercenaria]